MSDDDLIAELRGLDTWLEVPPAADQRAAVRARIARPDRRRRIRLWIAAGVAALAGTVAGVAPARAAVVDGFLHVAGIVIGRDEPTGLPAHPAPLPSLRSGALDDAKRVARFPVRVPAALGPPEQVLLADPDPGGAPRVVTQVYRGGTVRFDQFDGTVDPVFFKSAPAAEWVQVGAWTGVWLAGPHAVTYVGRDGVSRTATARLATPTLIWADSTTTYRLEGLLTLPEAMAVADSVG